MKVHQFGLGDYHRTWQAMRDFVDNATDDYEEEIWLGQHPAVYTLGRAGLAHHILRDNGIPVIRSDRGGQVTYHAPGQIVAYTLLNIRQRRLGLRELVRGLERAIVALLGEHGIDAGGDVGAPGVYVGGAKIAALGLRVKRGWSYHGVSLNVNMDLQPFRDINPCGYAGLAVTQMADFGFRGEAEELAQPLANHLQNALIKT